MFADARLLEILGAFYHGRSYCQLLMLHKMSQEISASQLDEPLPNFRALIVTAIPLCDKLDPWVR